MLGVALDVGLTGRSGSVDVASIPLRIAETQGRVITNWIVSGGSNNRHATYQPAFIPYSTYTLSVQMQGWVWRQYNNSYNNLPNNFTVERMWIECPNGNVVLVKWAGARTKLVAAGDNDVVSDDILASEAGYSTFPAGTYIIKSEISFSSAGSFPFVQNTFNVVSRIYNSASTTLTADTAGPLVFSGTAPTSPGAVGFKPILLGRHVSSTNKTFIALGDSISDGQVDAAATDVYGTGFMQRAMGNGGTNPYPCLGFYSHGGRTWWLKQEEDPNIGKWLALIKYAKHSVIEMSTNDIDAYSSPVLEADIKEVWAILRSEDIETITQVPLLANTNSTDNWATSGNQTAGSANWGAAVSRRSTYNAMLATELGLNTIDYLVDTAALLDVTDTWKWRTNGSAKFVNDDGVHPNANGHSLLATATRTSIDLI
jgi:lysophospholipase L1-like esterase